MAGTPIVPRVAAICGTIIFAGLVSGGISGCGLIASKPVDCGTIALQAESGRDDAEIASALGISLDRIASCRATETTASVEASTATP